MKKGFTMLEMILVVAVLSMLLILTVPNIQKVMGIVNRKGCDAQLKIVDTAILEYSLLSGNPPRTISDLINEGLLNEGQRYCQNHDEIILEDGQARLR
ncbi:MAG: prepilin-type N-terminal cleavage/methylation domain-containing protein [Erysipelotrichales bacterium]|nr:MAG: prepilin-type N-terminal cleavage/methylation domain-containing protein [Erysipelotrichales bacterium]